MSSLDEVCQLARELFSLPFAFVHLAEDTRRSMALQHDACAAVPQAFEPFCMLAALQQNLLLMDNLAAQAGFHTEDDALDGRTPVFWAGVPLLALPGRVAGTLMVADTAAREFRPEDRIKLETLARIAAEHLRLVLAHHDGARQEAFYRVLAENLTDTIVRGDLQGIRLYVSPSVRSLLGYEPDELMGKRAIDIVHPEDQGTFQRMLQDVLQGHLDVGMSEHRQRHKDGSWVWLESQVKLTRDPVTGMPDGYVASARNVAQRKATELQLSHLATHDPLTGLPNRLLLNERLRQEILRFKRTGIGFALFCLDLDDFKPVNDSCGHNMGDMVLRATADRLRKAVREEDMVARVGGDEFIIIQTNTFATPESSTRLAERLIKAVSTPHEISVLSLTIGVSIGIATVDDPALVTDAENLMEAADQALYQAKAAGKNRYAIFGKLAA